MGPRKSNSVASGKDDGATAGKVRKVGTSVGGGNHGGTITSSASNKSGTAAAAPPTADVSYTAEERTFLETQLALFTSAKSGVDATKMSREQWLAGLPTLVSATDRLLQAAAEQYQITCRERAAAASANAGASSGVEGSVKHGASTSSGSGNNGGGGGGADVHAHGATAKAGGPRSTPAAGTPAQFMEENAYILAQAQQLQWYPFTYQRWIEVLLEPGRYHTAREDGHLRGDAIQTSLRRCILVTYPLVEGGDFV
ncbi:hypothetical protein NESM_000085700 [Novymonas esmeraldas]|uniref:Uncharacterized protein n=1 Tax=Novymonas esmeraldas TaxID=1808958 RepID=A0AAW0F516_9TRYP